MRNRLTVYEPIPKAAMGNKQNSKIDKIEETGESGAQAIQRETNINKVPAIKFFETFNSKQKNGKISRKNFEAGLKELQQYGLKPIKSDFAAKLYDQLDTDRNGELELVECISGLLLMTGGTAEEKIEVYFRLYDADGSGGISQQELTNMIKSIWKNAFRALSAIHDPSGDMMDTANLLVDQLATTFSSQIFSSLDKNNDGVLSLDEFKEFAKQNPKVKAKLNGWVREVNLVNV